MSDAFQQVGVGPFAGKLRRDVSTDGLDELIARWQENPEEVIAKGRHRVIRYSLGEIPVAVKIFGQQSKLKDRADASRGSKASRSFEAARFLHQGGVHTPEPIGYLDHWEGQRLQRSLFITRYLPGLTDLRSYLAALYRKPGADIHDLNDILLHISAAIRKMHDLGFIHRDLGNQNLEFTVDSSGFGPVQVIDLNRGRILDNPTLQQRAIDLSRLTLPPELVQVFARMYWQKPVPEEFRKALVKARSRFHLWQKSRQLRRPLKHRKAKRTKPSVYPDLKDLWVWHYKSAQASILTDRKARKKLRTLGDSLKIASRILVAAPKVLRDYRDLKNEAFGQPVEMSGRMGMSIEAVEMPLEPQLELLRELPCRIPILVRYAHHQGPEGWQKSHEAIRQLTAEGHEVFVAVLQDRNAVNAPQSWSSFLEEIFETNHERVSEIEVTHAINRSKWGVHTLAEFTQLLSPLVSLQERYPNLKICGPACIDFEFHRVIGCLKSLPEGLKIGALSHHLYVDRRGAPESKQGSFSLLEKAALLKAIARASKIPDERVIVSEVNWPLLGTKDWSPVDATHYFDFRPTNPVNVSEDDYANYLERYYLISLCSGFVDRVYWWRLVAHGFGLVSEQGEDGWRKRPAFHRFKAMLENLHGTTFLRRHLLADPDSYCLEFEIQNRETIFVAWNSRSEKTEDLPAGLGSQILGESPIYLETTCS